MNILTLPTELLTEEILSQIPVSSLVSCLLTCKYLHHVIQSSIRLQYHFKLKQYAMVDNPSSSSTSTSYTYSSRLEMLEARERRWRDLEYDWRGQVSVPRDISGYYAASAGYYLLGRDNGRTRLIANKGVYVMKMPEGKEDLGAAKERGGAGSGGRWTLFDEEKVIIDFMSCIEQQDLIATILAVPQGPASYTTYIHLIQHSTGLDHPSARNPLIPLRDLLTSTTRPHVSCVIAGTHIALIITHYSTSDSSMGRHAYCLYVWNWRTGKEKGRMMLLTRDVVFLREDLVLHVCAGAGDTLQAIQIPKDGDDDDTGAGGGLRVVCTLDLPALVDEAIYSSNGLQCEPSPFHNPRSSSSTWSSDFSAPGLLHTNTPFFSNPDEAIIVLRLFILSPDGSDHFAFITHRAVLLSIIDRALRPSQPPQLPQQPDTVTNRDTDTVPSDPPSTSPIVRIAWDAWGPDNTRLLRTNSHLNPFLVSSLGTRWVRLASSEDESVGWDLPCFVHDSDSEPGMGVSGGSDAGAGADGNGTSGGGDEGVDEQDLDERPRRRIEVFDFNRVLIRKTIAEWEQSSSFSPSSSSSSLPANVTNIQIKPPYPTTPRGQTLFRSPTTTAHPFEYPVTTRLPFILHTVAPSTKTGDEEGREWRVKVPSATARTRADVWRWRKVAMTAECLIGITDGSGGVWRMEGFDLLHFG